MATSPEADHSSGLLITFLAVSAIPMLGAIGAHERWGAEPSMALAIAMLAARGLVQTWWASHRRHGDGPEER